VQVKLERVKVRTRRIGEFVEITALVAEAVARSGVREGVALVRSRHTTAAVTAASPTRACTRACATP
jgi:thiamine phosphate synthase YjbQ (UPF0047 family)